MRAYVKLTDAEMKEIQTYIVEPRNVVKACRYADLHYLTFKKALDEGGVLLLRQRRRLLEFCKELQVSV